MVLQLKAIFLMFLLSGLYFCFETELAQRLSPRSKNSSWTELNKERVRRLERLGLMRKEGREALPDMDPESFRIDAVIEQ